MFRELYAVARHTPLHLIITPRGEQLQVIIIPKPGDDVDEDSALHQPISAIGTPEELDQELPDQIERYTGLVNATRLKLDLPTDALDAEAASTNKSASTPSPASPAGKKTKKATRNKTAKINLPAPAKSSTPLPESAGGAPAGAANASAPTPTDSTPQRSETAPGSAGTSTVGATPAPDGATPSTPAGSPPPAQSSDHPNKTKPPRHPDLPARQPKIDRASKEQCLDDGRAYLVAIGAAKPSRELFVRWALTGRRYEKLWDNFADFLADVRGEVKATLGERPDDSHPGEQLPGSGDITAIGKATDSAGNSAAGQITKLSTAGQWPFPRAKEEDWQAVAPKQEPARTIRNIVTDTGIVLTATVKAYDIGDKYTHAEFGEYRVTAAEPTRYIVTTWADEAPSPAPANNLTLALEQGA